MRPSLDSLLTQVPPSDSVAMGRALIAAREELARKQPVRRWRTQAVWVVAASVGMVVAVAGVLLALGQVDAGHLLRRSPLFALLWVTAAVCAWGALSPSGHRLRLGGIALAMVSATLLVASRGAPHAEPTLPGWVCTASHFGVALVPLLVALLSLRGAAFLPLRAIVAGLAVGTTGALVGELACAQGWRHVAGYHLSAWALVAGVALAVSRSLKPRSFAP
jgi:hypothetical protein